MDVLLIWGLWVPQFLSIITLIMFMRIWWRIWRFQINRTWFICLDIAALVAQNVQPSSCIHYDRICWPHWIDALWLELFYLHCREIFAEFSDLGAIFNGFLHYSDEQTCCFVNCVGLHLKEVVWQCLLPGPEKGWLLSSLGEIFSPPPKVKPLPLSWSSSWSHRRETLMPLVYVNFILRFR